jgi:hypothetical protein
MNAEQEYKQLKRKLKENEGRLATNNALQEIKRKELFKKLKVDNMADAEVKIKKLGKSAKIAEVKIQKLLKALNDEA